MENKKCDCPHRYSGNQRDWFGDELICKGAEDITQCRAHDIWLQRVQAKRKRLIGCSSWGLIFGSLIVFLLSMFL